MGLACGWLVLGVGWIVELEKASSPIGTASNDDTSQEVEHDKADKEDHSILIVSSKSRSSKSAEQSSADVPDTDSSRQQSSPDLSHTSSDQTESTALKTPYSEDGPNRSDVKQRTEYEQLKLMVRDLSI